VSRELAARLAHDVGKYVARTARNVADGPVPAPVLAMLVKDLWELPAGGRASVVFERLAAPLRPDPRLEEAGGRLAEIDALESAVRAGDDGAVRRACALALEVERLLRAVAKDGGT
jgi:hypothetical protein